MIDQWFSKDASLSRRMLLKFAVATSAAIPVSALIAACGDDDEDEPGGELIPTGDGADTPDAGADVTPTEEDEEAADGGEDHVVEMNDQLKFAPEELTIAVGDTVTWRTVGAVPHTSTADPELANDSSHVQLPEGAQSWDSGNVSQGEEYSHTFEVPGNYTYFCIPHETQGMIGHITVEE